MCGVGSSEAGGPSGTNIQSVTGPAANGRLDESRQQVFVSRLKPVLHVSFVYIQQFFHSTVKFYPISIELKFQIPLKLRNLNFSLKVFVGEHKSSVRLLLVKLLVERVQ